MRKELLKYLDENPRFVSKFIMEFSRNKDYANCSIKQIIKKHMNIEDIKEIVQTFNKLMFV